jgi:transcriptional regulator with XRE-family HTH domain
MTQAETAARAGIRLETLSRLENGRANPTVATLRAILRALEGGPA